MGCSCACGDAVAHLFRRRCGCCFGNLQAYNRVFSAGHTAEYFTLCPCKVLICTHLHGMKNIFLFLSNYIDRKPSMTHNGRCKGKHETTTGTLHLNHPPTNMKPNMTQAHRRNQLSLPRGGRQIHRQRHETGLDKIEATTQNRIMKTSTKKTKPAPAPKPATITAPTGYRFVWGTTKLNALD